MIKHPSPNAEARQAVARLVGKFFLRHLLEEVQKPEAVLQEDYPSLPVRALTYEMIARVQSELQISPGEPLPEFNIFETWCALNGKFEYADSALFGYNRIFLPGVLELRDGTPEGRERHHTAMRRAFDNFDYEKEGFTVSFFLNAEGTMRELLREAVREHLPELGMMGEEIIVVQSRAFQTAMYEYFEGVLKATLADNVRLLHGILPQQVASELKQNGFVKPVFFPEAAVIFTDFESFSQVTSQLPPAEVIRRLDTYFSEFDRITVAYGLEKIKTIGDSYMAVAGVPEYHDEPVRAACDAALEILAASQRISARVNGWNIRIGIHVGPLVAGVIGRQKFSYDVWGATVNLASRMESSGAPGRINVSADVHARVKDYYEWEARGAQPIKRLGTAEMFFLVGKKAQEAGVEAAAV